MWSLDDQITQTWRQPCAEEGVALLEKAAGQGHAYAMWMLGSVHDVRSEYVQAMEWFTKAAEAGLPKAMFSVGVYLDKGKGVAAPDYPAAAGWYKRAADADHGLAAANLANLYTLGRGRGGTENEHSTDVDSTN